MVSNRRRRALAISLIMAALMLLVTPAVWAQKTPYERCLALGDRENNRHVDNCVRRYGSRAEKQEWFRSLAEGLSTEMYYHAGKVGGAQYQRCIKKNLRNPDKLCGGYLGIECKAETPMSNQETARLA